MPNLDAANRRWKKLVDSEGSVRLTSADDIDKLDRQFWQTTTKELPPSCDTKEQPTYTILPREVKEAILSCPGKRYTCHITTMLTCEPYPTVIVEGVRSEPGANTAIMRRTSRTPSSHR